MIEVNVHNLSVRRLPPPCPAGQPSVIKVHTYYSLYATYSIWDPRTDDWWRNKRKARRAWSTPGSAEETINLARQGQSS